MVPGKARAETRAEAEIRAVVMVLGGAVVLQAMDQTQVLHLTILVGVSFPILFCYD